MKLGTRPNITHVQVATFVSALLALLVAFGIDLSDAQIAAILGFVGVLGTGAMIADSIIRWGRNIAHANELAAFLADDQFQTNVALNTGTHPTQVGRPGDPEPVPTVDAAIAGVQPNPPS